MHNILLDECGDSDIINSKKSFVDPALKFFDNIPLMMDVNEILEEQSANVTPYRYRCLKLKQGYQLLKDIWWT